MPTAESNIPPLDVDLPISGWLVVTMDAQRVLADGEQLVLNADAQQEWERVNSRPARILQGAVAAAGATFAP